VTGLYPDIEPYDHGFLDVGAGQRLYWEACGNPLGKPALALHGGPGSGSSPRWRRYFDPNRYRAILFDQRGAGRSTPHASAPDCDFSVNDTPHLLADIERLRSTLGIERWLVLGGSWGATLALAYAQKHPERVTELALFSVATTTNSEIEWITRGVGRFFPEAWTRFAEGVPAAEREGCLAAAYNKLLMNPDPVLQEAAAQRWCDWESAIVALSPDDKPHPRFECARFRLGFARLVTHYWRHRAWMEDGALLAGMDRIADIPGALIHGALDLGSPLMTPWRLAQAWPAAELVTALAAGHDARQPDLALRIVAALDRFAV